MPSWLGHCSHVIVTTEKKTGMEDGNIKLSEKEEGVVTTVL